MLSKEEIKKVKKGLKEELGRTIIANECGLSTNDFSKSIKILEDALRYIEQLETREQKLTYARNWYFKHTTAQITTPEQLDKILSFDYVSKEKVEETFEYIEDYFERLNGPDEDIEYIREKKKELLESEE